MSNIVSKNSERLREVEVEIGALLKRTLYTEDVDELAKVHKRLGALYELRDELMYKSAIGML